MVKIMRKLLSVVFLLLFTIIVVGCGDSDVKAPESNRAVMGIDGLDKIKAEHAGKVILVNFFASWCPPCRAEVPDFVKVYGKLKDKNFVIIGLSVDEKKSALEQFVVEQKIPYPVYFADPALSRKYGIQTIPTNIFYGADGQLAEIKIGQISEKFIEDMYEKLK